MGEIIASPSARRLGVSNKVELERLAIKLGTDTISRADVELKITEKRSEGQCRPSHWDVDHSAWGPVRAQDRPRLETATAANLAAAVAAIPQVTTSARANRAKLESIRRNLNLRLAEKGIKITALAFQIAALARALRKFPKFNSSLSADGRTLWLKGYVSVGVAVDTPRGLVVPVIRNADKKGWKPWRKNSATWQVARGAESFCSQSSAAHRCPFQIFGGNRIHADHQPARSRDSRRLANVCRTGLERDGIQSRACRSA